MRKWIVAILLVTPLSTAPLAAYADTVFLLEDGVIRKVEGTVTREIPGKSITIRTRDGRELTYSAEDVVNVTRSHESPLFQDASGPSRLFVQDYRNPTTALLFSFLIPGGGQFYNGEKAKGFMQFTSATVGVVLFFSNFSTYSYNGSWVTAGNSTLATTGLSIFLASSLWSIIDAPVSAQRINRLHGFTRLRPRVNSHGFGLAASWSF